MNPKAAAWNEIGGRFWREGRRSARPSGAEIAWFLGGIRSGERALVVGASTRDLVLAAVDRGLSVAVVDFSAKMLADLADELGDAACAFVHADVLQPIPELAEAGYVLADRLINRFERGEADRFFQRALSLLRTGGELRTTVKLGRYDFDERILALARARGISTATFYDESTETIDYAQAVPLLAEAGVQHGEIPAELLLRWYGGRGRESRYTRDDVVAACEAASEDGRRFRVVEDEPCPDAPATRAFRAVATAP